MTPRERQMLIEQATSAWRPRDADGGLRPHPAWADLDAAGRVEAAEMTLAWRAVEAALDPTGLSTTAHAVLARIRGGR